MSLAPQFVPLDPKQHATKHFDCGKPVLNEFLARYADKNKKLGLSSTWVLIEDKPTEPPQKAVIAAYYTLASATVSRAQIPTPKNLPAYPVPVVLLARLAVDCRFQKRGLGEKTLVSALRRSVELTDKGLPALGVILDVLDDDAWAFYQRFDVFQPLTDSPMRLFISMNVLRQL